MRFLLWFVDKVGCAGTRTAGVRLPETNEWEHTHGHTPLLACRRALHLCMGACEDKAGTCSVKFWKNMAKFCTELSEPCIVVTLRSVLPALCSPTTTSTCAAQALTN